MSRVPIRIRIALLAVVAAAVTTAVIGAFTLARSESRARAEFDASLAEETTEATVAVQGGLSLEAFQGWDHEHGLLRIGLFDETGALVDFSEPGRLVPSLDRIEAGFFDFDDPVTGEELRGYSTPVVFDGSAGILVSALATTELADHEGSLRFFVVALAVVVTAVVGWGAYIVTGLVLGPIERLRRSAEDLAGEPVGRRLELPRARDEVRRLAETLNVALEQIDESMESQRRFLAEASHELRTPIARLRADIDLASRPTRSHEEVVAALAGFDRHADHLTTLADNFLARLTPQQSPSRLPLPVRVNRIVANLRHFAPHGESVQIDVPGEVGRASVMTEPVALVGVLSNMVDNAFRHGAPPVELAVRRIDNGLMFAVSDCGPGISTAVREQVVQPYRQGSTATTGTGLGLAIVHEFATSRGGELIIEDADPGCRMVLRLPFEFVTK